MRSKRLPIVGRTLPSQVETTIQLVLDQYSDSRTPWILGFSGGKDSSALLRIVYTALARAGKTTNPVSVLYCDTGVEIPVVASLVRATLRKLAREAVTASLPLHVSIARPRIRDSYFVRVIGRGYPPPTNKFRWCTDRLRIDPVQRTIASSAKDGALVLLGVRKGESPERDRTLERVSTDQPFLLTQRGGADTSVFAPLLNYSTEDIWDTLAALRLPTALDSDELAHLYRQTAGDCPIIRDPNGTPCGRGRFGCWTCTVVRRDHGMTALVESGHAHLAPLLGFRDWLQNFRDEPGYRCALRRNGQPGPGPFTLVARQRILRRLRSAERRSGLRLIRPPEVRLIHELWREDRASAAYRRIERVS